MGRTRHRTPAVNPHYQAPEVDTLTTYLAVNTTTDWAREAARANDWTDLRRAARYLQTIADAKLDQTKPRSVLRRVLGL